MIALTHNMRIKGGLVRAGEWDRRSQYMGWGKRPQGVLNPEVLESASFGEKWRRFHG
jgi:hypothetical protein